MMFIVMYVGCIECGEETALYGCYKDEQHAQDRIINIVEHDDYYSELDFKIVPISLNRDVKVVVVEGM
jgi:hypothetical protein